MVEEPKMTLFILLLLGASAGYVVNRSTKLVASTGGTGRGNGQKRPRPSRLQSPPWRTSAIYVIAFGLAWLTQRQFGWTALALLTAVEAWFFLAIAVIDLDHQRVLNRMLVPAYPLLFAANLFIGTASLSSLLFGGLAGFGLLLVVALARPGAMGMGDVKLAGLIGVTVGLGNLLLTLYIAILLGGIVAALLLFVYRMPRHTHIAYAPYLVLGTWVVLFSELASFGRFSFFP